MTMPHLMNCEHQAEGWCLDCVGKLQAECEALRKDAERYRWLMDAPSDWAICVWVDDDEGHAAYFRDSRGSRIVGEAIDAAMGKGGEA